MGEGEILIVEDEVLILLEIEAGLEEAGFKVCSESNAERALATFDAEPDRFRALIADIRLGPGKSGWDLTRYVRAVNPIMPVIYMSGDSAHEWPVKGVPGSIMIPKPFFMPQVITALATLLNEQRLMPVS
ncbi:transcriptional regulator [Mesorhizobium sp. LCM 4577]|uniref:Putative two-component response regulator n=1 Tax=Mesorhizobium plurifarium TaxID=69974 RepID=A0A090DFS1_MESPL|nr:response regulator [Mesorhizobium sp. LCM 4577]OHV69003.1 transcriptional regulator [Mesorhizobium sp. LCM 4577]CDX11967.1 putative two-component response regulator [Mesorhizobium plurifarium]